MKTLAEILEEAMGRYMMQVHTMIPGRVLSYDPSTLTAKVEPLIKVKNADGEELELPALSEVPVIFPRTKKAVIQFPLEEGDGVALIIAEASLEEWWAGFVQAPKDARRFALMDAVCVPGLFAPSYRGKIGTGSGLEIIYEGNFIRVSAEGIDINGDTKYFVTHAELDAALQMYNTLLMAHVHGGVLPGGSSTSPPSSPLTIDITAAKTMTVRTK